MEVYKTLVALGTPTLFVCIVAMFKYLRKVVKDTEILKSAVQNQMRSDLMKDGKRYLKDCEISELELYDWKARYEAYHNLGKNGVLDALNEEIINIAIHT